MDVANINTPPLNPVIEPAYEPVVAVSAEAQSVAPEKVATEQNPNAGFMPEHLDDQKIEDMLSKGVRDINKKLAQVSSNEMSYSYHKPTRSVAVTVFNSQTKEVVREIPPQKALDALAKMWELAGIIVDEKR